jgi:hypothetical protein
MRHKALNLLGFANERTIQAGTSSRSSALLPLATTLAQIAGGSVP